MFFYRSYSQIEHVTVFLTYFYGQPVESFGHKK